MTDRRATLRLQYGEDSEPETVPLPFDESEWARLERFLSAVARMETCQLIRARRNIGLKFNYSAEAGVSTDVDMPPEVEIREFLHVLRPLILQSEEVSFSRTSALIGRRLDAEAVRLYLRQTRRIFDGTSSQAQAVLTANGIVVNADDTVRTWLNAYEYHTDSDLQAKLEPLSRALPIDTARAFFILLLLEKARACQLLSLFVGVLLGRRDELEVPGRFLS